MHISDEVERHYRSELFGATTLQGLPEQPRIAGSVGLGLGYIQGYKLPSAMPTPLIVDPFLASVPASVVVAAGATSNTFTVTTSSPKKNTSATLSATYGGTTKTVTMKVTRR